MLKVQLMITKALEGVLPLIGRESGYKAFKDQVLLRSFSDEKGFKREAMHVEEPGDFKNNRRRRQKIKLGLKKESNWVEKTNDEGGTKTLFFQSKSDPSKVKFKPPEDDEYDFKEEDVMTVRGALLATSAWKEDSDGNFVLKDAQPESAGTDLERVAAPSDDDFSWEELPESAIQEKTNMINKMLILLKMQQQKVHVTFNSLAPEWST